jgi:hypothetical protein
MVMLLQIQAPRLKRALYFRRMWLLIMKCDTSIKMIRANNVLKYESLDQSLAQYIIQLIHSRTTLFI